MIFAVVVLYKCTIDSSETINSLKNSLANLSIPVEFEIIVIDNGEVDQAVDVVDLENFKYVRGDNRNGLAGAYNTALNLARKKNGKWLLLLDQDTTITSDFIFNLVSESCVASGDVAAIIPTIYSNGIIVSPAKEYIGGVLRGQKPVHAPVTVDNIFAIGSCSLVRVSFFEDTNGFTSKFKIDSLDRWLYNQICLRGKKVRILTSIINHNLSIFDTKTFVSKSRYEGILQAELLFMSEYRSTIDMVVYKMRLLYRSLKHFITLSDKMISIIDLKFFFK